jgi:hypothetical protein
MGSSIGLFVVLGAFVVVVGASGVLTVVIGPSEGLHDVM